MEENNSEYRFFVQLLRKDCRNEMAKINPPKELFYRIMRILRGDKRK